MDDVLGRRLTVRLTERDPGNGSAAHRHPGSHTVGYILEGNYEVKINDGPVQTLKPGSFLRAAECIARDLAQCQRDSAAQILVIQTPTRRNRHGPGVTRRWSRLQ